MVLRCTNFGTSENFPEKTWYTILSGGNIAGQNLVQKIILQACLSWYDSCKNVFYPALSDTVVAITCSPPPGKECDAYEWLRYLNTNAFSPIDVPPYFIAEKGTEKVLETSYTWEEFRSKATIEGQPFPPIGNEKMLPMNLVEPISSQGNGEEPYIFASNATLSLCSEPEPWSNSEETCSCVDCKTKPGCVTELITEEATSSIAFYIIAPVLWVLLVAYFSFMQLYWRVRHPRQDSKHGDQETVLEDLYLRMYNRVGRSFRWWAEQVVCRWPLLTILVVSVCLAVLTAGFPQTEFTTDPVELWVDPATQNYEELKFYNDKFDPFYRSELVIASLKEEYKGPGFSKFICQGQNVEFSEIFRNEYLEEFFTLQEQIFQMSNIDPKEICFAPLAPDSKNCATQSIYQYWQNDLELFRTEYMRGDYGCLITEEHPETEYFGWHDHFVACLTNPSSVDDLITKASCLGDYGGPALPFVALGGYPVNKETQKKT